MNTDYKYTLEFYRLLESNAERELIDDIELMVFRGALTKLFKGLGVSQSYYSKVMDALKDLGSITVLKRGARGVDSIVAVHSEPIEIDFLMRGSNRLTSSPQAARLSERVADLEKRLGGMSIVDAIDNLDRRLKALERNTGG